MGIPVGTGSGTGFRLDDLVVRRAARVDANQKKVVAELRIVPGVSVAVTSGCGNGFPDLVVGAKGVNILVELKDPDKPPSARKLTPAESRFMECWQGQYMVALTADEILSEIFGEDWTPYDARQPIFVG